MVIREPSVSIRIKSMAKKNDAFDPNKPKLVLSGQRLKKKRISVWHKHWHLSVCWLRSKQTQIFASDTSICLAQIRTLYETGVCLTQTQKFICLLPNDDRDIRLSYVWDIQSGTVRHMTLFDTDVCPTKTIVCYKRKYLAEKKGTFVCLLSGADTGICLS